MILVWVERIGIVALFAKCLVDSLIMRIQRKVIARAQEEIKTHLASWDDATRVLEEHAAAFDAERARCLAIARYYGARVVAEGIESGRAAGERPRRKREARADLTVVAPTAYEPDQRETGPATYFDELKPPPAPVRLTGAQRGEMATVVDDETTNPGSDAA